MKSFVLGFSHLAYIVPTGTMLPPFLSQGHSSPLLTPDVIYILSNTAISTPNKKKEAPKESINLSLPET